MARAEPIPLENEDLCEIAAAIENGRAMDEPFISRLYAALEQVRIGGYFVVVDTPGLDVKRLG